MSSGEIILTIVGWIIIILFLVWRSWNKKQQAKKESEKIDKTISRLKEIDKKVQEYDQEQRRKKK